MQGAIDALKPFFAAKSRLSIVVGGSEFIYTRSHRKSIQAPNRF